MLLTMQAFQHLAEPQHLPYQPLPQHLPYQPLLHLYLLLRLHQLLLEVVVVVLAMLVPEVMQTLQPKAGQLQLRPLLQLLHGTKLVPSAETLLEHRLVALHLLQLLLVPFLLWQPIVLAISLLTRALQSVLAFPGHPMGSPLHLAASLLLLYHSSSSSTWQVVLLLLWEGRCHQQQQHGVACPGTNL